MTQIENGPLYLGSINSGFKVSEDYIDANLNLVAPVWSSLGSNNQLGGGILFLEPYVSWGENGEVATSLGLGYRYLFNDQPVSALRSPRDDQAGFWDEGLAIGANFFVDMLDTEADNQFWQLGFGLEVATRYIELRGNYYLPLTDKQLAERRTFTEKQTSTRTTTRPVTQTSAPYDDGQGLLVQDQTTSLVATTTTTTTLIRHLLERYEEGMEGWDAEVALLVPGLDKWCDVKLLGGYFQLDNAPFGPQKGGTGNVEGWKAGVEVRPVPAVAVTAMWYEDERFLGNDWVFGARMEIPFEAGDLGDGKGMWGRIRDAFVPRRRHLVERMAEPVHRQNAAIHIANTEKQSSKVSKQSTSSNTQVISQTKNKIVLGPAPSSTEFTPVGAGTLTFNGYDSYGQGVLFVNKLGNAMFVPAYGGTVIYVAANLLGSSAVQFYPSGLSITGMSSISYQGALNMNSALTKAGAGVLTLSASNSYYGGAAITGVTLSVSNGYLVPGESFIINQGATVSSIGYNASAFTVNSYGSSFSFNNYGSTSINSGLTLELGGSYGGTTSWNSSGGAVLQVSNTYGGISKVGAGTLVINGAGTYSGGSSLTLSSDITINSAQTLNTTNFLSTNRTITSVAGANTSTVTNINTANFISGGTITNVNASTFAADTGTITNSDGTATLRLNALSTGGGALIKSGTGAFQLTGANSYVGTTTVSGGILRASSWAALGTQTNLVISSVSGTGSIVLPEDPGSAPASIVIENALRINGSSIPAGSYSIQSNTIQLNSLSIPLSGAILTAP